MYSRSLSPQLKDESSPLLQRPVIGYIVVEGVDAEFVGLFVIIGPGDGVYHISRVRAIGFEAMKNQGRDVDKHRVVLANEELVDQSSGRRIFPLVIEGNFGHAFNYHHVVALILVIVPGFYHTGIAGGDIHLTKFLKHGVIAPEQLH